MIRGFFAMITPDMVPEKHFFLEQVATPGVIWGIRGVCIAMAIAALIIYFKMKNKRGE